MEQATLLPLVEAVLRIILGLRFLSSGISNVRRWPHAPQTAGLVFPQGAYFFGFIATALMVLGGGGLALGFQTPIAAVMLITFLIPTFKVHHYWLQNLPGKVRTIQDAITNDQGRNEFPLLVRQAIHSHETGWQNNIVLLAASLFFVVRGSVAFGLDNLMENWVIRLF